MKRLVAVVIAAVAGFAAPAAGQPLVDAAWLRSRLEQPNLVVLDLREAGAAEYAKARIPGAIFTDYAKGGWRVPDRNGTPGMLPDAAALEKLIGGLGISNDSHVVIVPDGTSAREVGRAARIYWTFKVAGHDAVSILDGGMAAWTANKQNPLASGTEARPPAVFKVKLRPKLLATKDDVKAALARGVPLVDNRPPDMFMGVNRTKDVPRNGTLPGARSLPESWLTEDNGGRFRDRATLAKLYAAAGVPTEGEQITFCNTGHWASLGWFASHEILGNRKVRMYDGSMAEWTRDAALPTEVKVPLR